MRLTIAIILAKFIMRLSKLLNHGGTQFSSRIAKLICPDILKVLSTKNFAGGIIVVTGTNGKTSTTMFIAQILRKHKINYVHNSTGANMNLGIIAAIIEKANLRGIASAPIGLFEIDETSLPSICKSLKPTIIVVTNLFRDQLDRFGEIDKIATMLRVLFAEMDKSTQLILNADDPLVASLGVNYYPLIKQPLYFGLELANHKLEHDTAGDSVFDPFTLERLHYTQQYFAHLGKYVSLNKGFSRPAPDYEGHDLKQNGIHNMQFLINNIKESVSINTAGIFGVYNAIAAFTAAKSIIKSNDNNLIQYINDLNCAFGRSEIIEYKERNLMILLTKNPTGFNQIIQAYLLKEKNNLLVIVINDDFPDGRDVSWLWDIAMEDITGYQGKIILSGTRALDMALRLKYADIIKNVVVELNINKLLNRIIRYSESLDTIFILSNYTAMLQLRQIILSAKSEEHKLWQ